MKALHIAFFGSSLVSAYWNGAATYYRGLIRALADRGHRVTFFEPDAFERQQHRDMTDPDWAEVVVYSTVGDDEVLRCLERAGSYDVVVKASGVGVFDELLEREVALLQSPDRAVIFWDVDAPATLARMEQDADDPLRSLIRTYDLVLTYGGGPPVVNAYRDLGAADCIPIYNALDPETHFRVSPDPQFAASLAFVGNRLPDREQRVFEFFFEPARRLPDHRFLLAGSGWHDNLPQFDNVKNFGHLYTHQHNAFNSTPLAILNVSRDAMAATGYSPATRLFEAAGAGACLITDEWVGIEDFLEPGRQVLVAADRDDVARHLGVLSEPRARRIGEAARQRILREHTYETRARQVECILTGGALATKS